MKSTNMKLKHGLLCTAFLPLVLMAQKGENLVENGGFESISAKPKKAGQIDLATGWKSPTGVRADLYTDSKVPGLSTSSNTYGSEDPKEGRNYAGIVAYSYGNKVPRSYVLTKLKEPLKADQKYCVQFYVSLAEASKFSSNQMAINFNKKEFASDGKTPIIDESSVLHAKNKVINATFGWELVCATYIAKGGEKFLTIGNFTADDATKNERNKKVDNFKGTQLVAAYYYIDDVSVKLLEQDEVCDCGVDEAVNDISTTIYAKAVVLNDKMTPQQKIDAQSTYFAFGKDRLAPQGIDALNLVAAEMKAHQEITITLVGHSDKAEDDLAEKKPIYADMDKKRIATVKEYLVSKGVPAARIMTKTVGNTESNPEITESDDDDLKMAKNRRVTIMAK